ncbi:glutathione S-transferase family protein [Pseudovibrio exalbescens]|uniref:glutathione S-transferase family protein n=1 Tax=Pseudovibrio exalbescens TaxID=197461 RepID=UPI00236701D1|nr:glutathione S-transferase family protein [Pseudovibrio exalbescens]MDD7908334.1 glutathione S-transferase family protein [Pseudovibrio exalbescens]
MSRLTLYWISGSPPAWRVMLALVLKGVPFDHRLLDVQNGENRAPEYLALNPKGQVPTLVMGDVALRESLAILAWLDRAFPDRPIWGDDTKSAARVWQDVMLMEVDLRPAVTSTAQSLLRNRPLPDADRDALLSAADDIAETLESTDFLGGDAPMANDIWLYPALHWIARGVVKSASPPEPVARLSEDRPSLKAWMKRMSALPGVAETYPPHWR